MNYTKRLLVLLMLLAIATVWGAPGAFAKDPDPRAMKFPPLDFKVPKSERVQLKNGMVVYLLADHELPIVNVTAYVGTGGVYDPADKVGLASLVGATLRSGGTKRTSADQLDKELEFMASSIESGIDSDIGSVSCATLTRNLDRTLALFAQVLTEPAFEPARVELARNHALEGIRRQNDDPKAVGDRELREAVYQGHPLGRIPTQASVKAVTREDLLAFQKRYFFPKNIILAVAGDFDRDKLLARLDELFAAWPNESTVFPQIPQPSAPLIPEVLLVQKDVNQSVIRMGHLGIDKSDPDLYALRVMDHILGGGFTSRLTQEIRSNRGLAYNVFSFNDVGRRFTGSFIAETETKTESTAKVVGLMESIIAGMTKAEVTPQELSLAKDSIINSFIFGFATPMAVVNQQARLEYYGYPPGYLDNYRANIAKVTAADVLRAARKHLHPEAMKVVVVGNSKKFDAPLSQFGKVREITLECVK
ncbi:M16 family metallopeptidase [Geomesophilobacter sediminis]|uniref:Insulinase family protein n=1 Tax=Geomesophilobacter sediminis TaxID=2798584 RepID=A0A8J7M0T4_9BACT|nr:pitrilysin family protein [Geomesophilobacter sediminis]MBJ6726533.1 insulinase family protein [Geomesophilobacter sediminis]